MHCAICWDFTHREQRGESKNIIKKVFFVAETNFGFFSSSWWCKNECQGRKTKREMDYPQNDQPSQYFNIKYFYENRDAKFTRPAINLPFFSWKMEIREALKGMQ